MKRAKEVAGIAVSKMPSHALGVKWIGGWGKIRQDAALSRATARICAAVRRTASVSGA